MPPVVQHPLWGDSSVQVLAVCHTPFTMLIPQGDGAKHSKTHHHCSSSIDIEHQRYPLRKMEMNGVSLSQHRPRFMWPCQRQVNYCYTGGWALCPFPRQRKHSKVSPVSGSSARSEENWSRSLMLAAGTVGDSPIFLPFTIVSCYSYMHNTMHLIHTVFAFVFHSHFTQRRPNVQKTSSSPDKRHETQWAQVKTNDWMLKQRCTSLLLLILPCQDQHVSLYSWSLFSCI